MMKFNEKISINDENYDRTMTNVSLVYSRYGMLPQLANVVSDPYGRVMRAAANHCH